MLSRGGNGNWNGYISEKLMKLRKVLILFWPFLLFFYSFNSLLVLGEIDYLDYLVNLYHITGTNSKYLKEFTKSTFSQPINRVCVLSPHLKWSTFHSFILCSTIEDHRQDFKGLCRSQNEDNMSLAILPGIEKKMFITVVKNDDSSIYITVLMQYYSL